MPDFPGPNEEVALIQALLDRRAGADKKLQLVLEGAVVGNDFLSDRFSFRKSGVQWVASDQMARRLHQLGEERMHEVFALLAPGLEKWTLAAWVYMRTHRQRFEHGFYYPHIAQKRARYEAWWLREFFADMTRFPMPPAELAERAGFVEVGGRATDAAADYLVASVLSGGEVAETVMRHLLSALRGGIPGAGVTRLIANTLLRLPQREGWDALRDAVLNAGSEENVVGTILSVAHEGSDEAFHVLADAVRAHGLLRRPSALQSFNVWLGLSWKSSQLKQAQLGLEHFCTCLSSKEHRSHSVSAGRGEELYMTLWVEARADAAVAVQLAETVLKEDPDVARRFAALHLVSQIKHDAAHQLLCEALADSELVVACHAVAGMLGLMDGDDLGIDMARFRANCDSLLSRVRTAPKAPLSVLWPWIRVKPSIAQVEDLRPEPEALISEPPALPLTQAPASDLAHFSSLAQMHAGAESLSGQDAELFWRGQLLGVSSTYAALLLAREKAASLGTLDTDEFPFPQDLSDLRWVIMDDWVARQPEVALRAAQDWLSVDDEVRLHAGLELLNRLCTSLKYVSECRQTAHAFLTRKKIRRESDAPFEIRNVLSTSPAGSVIWDQIRSLVDRGQLTEPAPLSHHHIAAEKPTARLIVQALDEWLWERRDLMVSVDGAEPQALFSHYGLSTCESLSLEDDLKRLPLALDLRAWWESRPDSLRDSDGLELLRTSLFVHDEMAYAHDLAPHISDKDNSKNARVFVQELYGTLEPVRVHKRSPFKEFLRWLLRLQPPGKNDLTFLLDVLENRLLLQENNPVRGFWASWWCREIPFASFHGADAVRLWHACIRSLRAWDRQVRPASAIAAHMAGLATDSDLAFYLLGQTDPISRHGFGVVRRPPEGSGTARVMAACARLAVDHVLSHRSEDETYATVFSKACLEITSVKGASVALQCLALLGGEGPERKDSNDSFLRRSVLSRILKISMPDADDSAESFAAQVKELSLPASSLIIMAVFAPVWTAFIQHALGAEGFSDAVWWLHAHSRGSRLFDARGTESWQMELKLRTDIPLDDFKDGAVDVAWFNRIQKTLAPELWKAVHAAALFTNSGGGEAGAWLYASAILGEVKTSECTERIKKRHQDSVRALSLLPLPQDTGTRREEVRHRYEVLQEFRRGAHKFGAERRLNEERAAALALDNLARNAGYEDPVRMEWALEAEAVRALFKEADIVCVKDLTCSLRVTSSAEALIVAARAGKELKSLPAELKKHAAFKALKEARSDLQMRCRRARTALEGFMVRRTLFQPAELRTLLQHPLLAPLLEALVLLSDGRRGMPVDDGACLRDHDGTSHVLGHGDAWCIVHPLDLLPAAGWAAWQSFVVGAGIVQPFKQVFRELYVPVTDEDQNGFSHRYAGHLLRPAQALALIGQRGWSYDSDEGARKVMRHCGLTATVEFKEFFHVPSEVETITVSSVWFGRLGSGWQLPIPLGEVPPVIFSEIMRDLDLMVSVAWTGQGAPQFTPATMNMRAAMVRAVADAMKLTNIELTDRHANIRGQYGSYRVHLGSAVAMKSDGGMIWLGPVVKDAREPLFLPFADADPVSSEVLSKVLLLAQDHTIKNAELIRQLRES